MVRRRGATTLQGLPPEILLVPLPGHTPGHSAVAVRADRHWLLHCGDSYLFHGELDDPPRAHLAVEPIQRGTQIDLETRHGGQRWLRTLRRDHAAEVESFSAHDPWEYARLANPTLDP